MFHAVCSSCRPARICVTNLVWAFNFLIREMLTLCVLLMIIAFDRAVGLETRFKLLSDTIYHAYPIAVRNILLTMGVQLDDSSDGTNWRRTA